MQKRKTSAIAYNNIKESGMLSALRFAVYDYVYQYGPCTISEVSAALNKNGNSSGSYSSRFSELREVGLFEEVGQKKCSITGRKKLLWDVTDEASPKPFTQYRKKQQCPHCNGKAA